MIVKIGAVAATSGPVGLLGRSFLKAVQLAFEDLRNTTHQYQLIIEELESPDQAEPAIEKLVGLDAVNALVIATSASSQIVKGYTEAAKIPLFCVASIGSVGDEVYTFTTMPLAEDEATQWVTEAKRRGIKTVALSNLFNAAMARRRWSGEKLVANLSKTRERANSSAAKPTNEERGWSGS